MDQTNRREEYEKAREPVILPSTPYPKALYKGGFYEDYTLLTQDLAAKKIIMVLVENAEQEADARVDGFSDLSSLMEKPVRLAISAPEPRVKRKYTKRVK